MKILFLLCILLTGCVGIMPTAGVTPTLNSPPTKTIRNDKCFNSNKLKIFQVLYDGALAYLCPDSYPSYYDNAFDACSAKGDLVFISVNAKDNDFVDDQKIILPNNQCFMSNGRYTYMAGGGTLSNGVKIEPMEKTIRKIKISNSQVKNPTYAETYAEYEKQKTKQEKSDANTWTPIKRN